MFLKMLIYLAALYFIQKLIRDFLFPRPPPARVRGGTKRKREIDPDSADIEDARFKDLE